MAGKIVAIIGSYRRGGITDQAVEAALAAARNKGADTEKIYLTDKNITFCINCRACTQKDGSALRGKCVHDDDMDGILEGIDAADGIILASPVNFGTVTAIMKRFVERCIVYGYWPWGNFAPKMRPGPRRKKALLITSSGCPGPIARVLMPSSLDVMRHCAGAIGAKVVRSLYFGMASVSEGQRLSLKELDKCGSAGSRLAESL